MKFKLNETLFNEDIENNRIETEQLANEIVSQVVSLLRSRFDAIEQFNGFKQYATQSNIDNDIIEVIESIIADENKHIGLLQGILKSISPESENITNGEIEAAEKLN